MSDAVRVWVDGGSRGNPGPAATGYRIEDTDGVVLAEAGETIGTATNNVAEYRALIAGLRAAADLGARDVRGAGRLAASHAPDDRCATA